VPIGPWRRNQQQQHRTCATAAPGRQQGHDPHDHAHRRAEEIIAADSATPTRDLSDGDLAVPIHLFRALPINDRAPGWFLGCAAEFGKRHQEPRAEDCRRRQGATTSRGATGSGSPAIAASILSKVIDHVGAMAKSLMAETGAAESDVAAMPAGVGAPPEERQFELSGSSMCM
jgi:hypothetical protein